MTNKFNKLFAGIFATTILTSALVTSASAASFTSNYPKIKSHDIDGSISTYSNYTRAAYLEEINPAIDEDIRLKWTDSFTRYYVYVKLLDRAPTLGSNNESGTLLDSFVTADPYVDITDLDKYENEWIKVSIQGATGDTYSGVTNWYLPIGEAEYDSGYDDLEFTIEDSRYQELGVTKSGVNYGVLDEAIPSDTKFRMDFAGDFKYLEYFIKRLDGAPNPNSDNEAGELMKSDDSKRSSYLTITKSQIPDYEDSWVKLAVRGFNKDGSSSDWNYLYFYVNDDGTMPEFGKTFAKVVEQGSGFAEYTGFNYKTALKSYLNSGVISKQEYNSRLAVLEEAQKMVTVEWEAPVTFYAWKSSKGVYNNNANMISENSENSTSVTNQFVKGVTYTGIPYSMNPSYNRHTVDQWLDLINDDDIERSDLQGTVSGRSNTTSKGIDCSGFVYRAMQEGGYDGNYMTTSSLMTTSKYTTVTDPLPGDILVRYDSKVQHTMIYLGKQNGKICVFESTADGNNGVSGCRYYEYSPSELTAYIYRSCDAITD